jgi:hypothetical protein
VSDHDTKALVRATTVQEVCDALLVTRSFPNLTNGQNAAILTLSLLHSGSEDGHVPSRTHTATQALQHQVKLCAVSMNDDAQPVASSPTITSQSEVASSRHSVRPR